MLDDDAQYPLRVTDLKQWVYCPRIFYYQHVLPDVRPETFKMQAGRDAGRSEVGREERRSLRAYGVAAAEREFDVPVHSARLGVRGEIDMVMTVAGSGEVIPVDYKLSRIAGAHFQLQLAVYGLILEELRGVSVRRGFLYEIPLRRAVEIKLEPRLRAQALKAVEAMRRMFESEQMPAPTKNRRKCVACEFRRFCNDVI
jgi:CRISPR-associated exonuclease Cas4